MIVIYLYQQHTGLKLTEIAPHFTVNHYSTISQTIRRLLKEKKINPDIQKIINRLNQVH